MKTRPITLNGLVSNSPATIYTVIAGDSLYLRALVFQNPNTSGTNVVSVYLQPPDGTSRLWVQRELAPGDSLLITDHEFEERTVIGASATTASEVVWTLTASAEAEV